MREIVRKRILKKNDYKCIQCSSVKNLEIDHIIPLSRGGRHDEDNMQTLCRPCNRKKGAGIDLNKYFLKGDDKNFIHVRNDFPLNAIGDKDFKELLRLKIKELCLI